MITKYRLVIIVRKYLLPVMFGIVILGLMAYSIVLHTQKKDLELKLQAQYERSFQELMLDMQSLETKLSKLEASNDAYQSNMILMDIWRQTGDTESSISSLPVSYTKASPFIQFINRTGDYCRYLSKKVSEGQAINQDDLTQVKQIRESCLGISEVLDKAWQTGYLPPINTSTADFISDVNTGTQGNLDFSNSKYPRLIYDGPYSESVETKQNTLQGETIDEKGAKEKALEFVGEQNVMEMSQAQVEGGKIDSFAFDGKLKDGNEFSVNIAKQGGTVIWFMQQSNGRGNAVPSEEKYAQLAKEASEYLEQKGIKNTEATYAQFYAGNAIINMVPKQDDVILYPELIKVWLDIEQDRVVGMDASSYAISHEKREIEQPKLTKQEAAAKVTTRLKIEKISKAIIPTETKEEILCWEFQGSIDKQDYIIYINAETGKTEDIFIVKHTNEGTLVQ